MLQAINFDKKIMFYILRTQKEIKKAMNSEQITEKDKKMAQRCVECKLCSPARKKQRGLAFWFVRKIEDSICPFCKAYEKVYSRKAHETIPAE